MLGGYQKICEGLGFKQHHSMQGLYKALFFFHCVFCFLSFCLVNYGVLLMCLLVM
jgi:hypothetical protein